MKELMEANKIEKLSEEDTEKISGGYVGKDWNKKYAKVYGELGIKHVRNTFGYDEYYVCGHKVPKEYVYKVFDASTDDRMGNIGRNTSVKFDFDQLKKELKAGHSDMLTKIWEQYS